MTDPAILLIAGLSGFSFVEVIFLTLWRIKVERRLARAGID
jgi:hypothetical protein